MNKGLIYLIGAILYVLFPRDLVQDFLAGWGWLDDLLVLYFLWRYYRRQRLLRQSANHSDQTGRTADDHQSRTGDANPYTVLEIEAGASREEIKSAYRRLAAQYHPDKVQHLGREIRELAETRFKEIQQAYDILMKQA